VQRGDLVVTDLAEPIIYEQVSEPLSAPEPLPAGEPVPPTPTEPQAPAGSLQAKVQAARVRAQHAATVDLEIPGYDGTLWGTFRAIDDLKERVRLEKRWERVRDDSQKALHVSADLLRAANLDTFVPAESFVAGETTDGDRVALGLTLGLDLAAWLDVMPPNESGVVNDHSVLFPIGRDEQGRAKWGIFPSTLTLTQLANELHQFSIGKGAEADGEALGNS
jgi:hypothetical protein